VQKRCNFVLKASQREENAANSNRVASGRGIAQLLVTLVCAMPSRLSTTARLPQPAPAHSQWRVAHNGRAESGASCFKTKLAVYSGQVTVLEHRPPPNDLRRSGKFCPPPFPLITQCLSLYHKVLYPITNFSSQRQTVSTVLKAANTIAFLRLLQSRPYAWALTKAS
jgi:hypothetical protein